MKWFIKMIETVLRRMDSRQQRSTHVGFVYGVFRKYGDDRGGQLASLIAFSAFLSFFPLMLLIVTLTALATQRYAGFAVRLRNSAAAEFPIVGPELIRNNFVLPGSDLGLAVGLIGLLWAGLGFSQALQYAFLEVWHVPYKIRPSFLRRLARSAIVYVLLAGGVVASVGLGLLGSVVRNSRAAGALGLVGATVISGLIVYSVFWLLSPRDISHVDLLPGAVVTALGWQGLQVFATQVIGYQLRRSSELYGAIGAALALIWFLIVSAQILLYGIEINVVRRHRLWPRSITQTPLTNSDVDLLRVLAKQEERRPEETIRVSFHDEAAPDPDAVSCSCAKKARP